MIDLGQRSAEDAWLDAQRNPQAFLAHSRIAPGSRCAVLSAAGGYSLEIISRAIGPDGIVYSQEVPDMVVATVGGGEDLRKRLEKPSLDNVRHNWRKLDDPLPSEAGGLDKVFLSHAYHDTFWWLPDDGRWHMLEAAMDHLRPGGELILIDHAANDGRTSRDVQTIHRVEESLVRAELARVGFELVRCATYLRYADRRDWFVMDQQHPRFGKDDRFVHAYRRP